MSLKDGLSPNVTWLIFAGLFEDEALLIATLVSATINTHSSASTHAPCGKGPFLTDVVPLTLFPAQVAQLPLTLSDGRWHHICITWTTRDGFWEAYQDGERLGTGDNLAPWHPIKPGGVIILGQEQVRAVRKLRQYRVSMCALAPVCNLSWALCWRHWEYGE